MALSDDDGSMLQAVPSFEAIFVEEFPKMVALAAAVSGSRSNAEDIAQEAMSRLQRNWTKVQGFAKPGAWLRRVTINLAISQRRKLLTEAKTLLRMGGDTASLPPVAAEHEPLWAAVRSLPKNQRAAVALYVLEDRTIAEIADILDISPSTARVHLHRARQALRDQLDRGGLQ
jgi:RNA polymerase sigma factor (sigma-70 family)